jgi:hypothetical protein
LLVALAKELVILARNSTNADEKNFKNEFYTVCMLNALFGNPSLHVIHLLSDAAKFERAEKLFSNVVVENESDFIEDKKRRNAVTEFLRVYCDIEF